MGNRIEQKDAKDHEEGEDKNLRGLGALLFLPSFVKIRVIRGQKNMNQLYPIIRRARRPLLPLDEPPAIPVEPAVETTLPATEFKKPNDNVPTTSKASDDSEY